MFLCSDRRREQLVARGVSLHDGQRRDGDVHARHEPHQLQLRLHRLHKRCRTRRLHRTKPRDSQVEVTAATSLLTSDRRVPGEANHSAGDRCVLAQWRLCIHPVLP